LQSGFGGLTTVEGLPETTTGETEDFVINFGHQKTEQFLLKLRANTFFLSDPKTKKKNKDQINENNEKE